MAKTFVKDGNTIDYVNGGSAISAGDVVIYGNMIGVALEDIASSATGSVAVSGVWDLPKVSTGVFTQGELVVWDVSTTQFQANGFITATGDVTGGAVVTKAAGNPSSTVNVKLLPGSGAVA